MPCRLHKCIWISQLTHPLIKAHWVRYWHGLANLAPGVQDSMKLFRMIQRFLKILLIFSLHLYNKHSEDFIFPTSSPDIYKNDTRAGMVCCCFCDCRYMNHRFYLSPPSLVFHLAVHQLTTAMRLRKGKLMWWKSFVQISADSTHKQHFYSVSFIKC